MNAPQPCAMPFGAGRKPPMDTPTEEDPRDMQDTFVLGDDSTWPPVYFMDGDTEYLTTWDAHCTATTTRGARCANQVLGGAASTMPADDAEREPLAFDAESQVCAVTGLCRLHARRLVQAGA